MNIVCLFSLLFLCLVKIQPASSSPPPNNSFFGPLLNFIDAGVDNDRWNISVLLIAPKAAAHGEKEFFLKCDEASNIRRSEVDEINDYCFLKYDLSFVRDSTPHMVTYRINDKGSFSFWLPARKTDPHVFFGSCNKYKESTSMWNKINKKHSNKPFHLGILAGDQIYMDAGGKDGGGVFDVDSVKSIMLSNEETRMAPLSDVQEEQIDQDVTKFVLQHYLNHYSKDGFRDFLATVPCKSIDGDHEFYDGKGSYDKVPPIMNKIAKISNRFYFLFQHHTAKERAKETGLIGPLQDPSLMSSLMSYSYLLQFETMAFCGLDTRSERTPTQVISPKTRDFMFNRLKGIRQRNIFIITEIPLVYQNLNPLYTILQFFNNHPSLKALYSKISGIAKSKRNLDISLDIFDEWGYRSHIEERNLFIQKLIKEVYKPERKITLLGGDVHSAGAAEVVYGKTGETMLWQITSSAVTTEPIPRFLVWFKRFISWFQKQEKYDDGLVGKITGYQKPNNGEKSREIALNNWLELEAKEQEIYPTLWTLPSETSDLEKWLLQGWINPDVVQPLPIVVK